MEKITNNLPFLIAKQDAGEAFTDLDELLSMETFNDEQIETVDNIMKVIGDIDDDTASAIGDLLLCVTAQPEIAKYVGVGWPSISDQEQVKMSSLIHKSELNTVEIFIQEFASKSEMESDELEVIEKALETISDLDADSLGAVYLLLKVGFSPNTVAHRWPSFFKSQQNQEHEAAQTQSSVKKKTGLRWPSIVLR